MNNSQLIQDAIIAARNERLNRGLLTLASWAHNPSLRHHDTATTITMLERKVAELRIAVDKAGWDAVAELADRLPPTHYSENA